MPIITKPSSIERDIPATFTLDKAVLAALPIVVANSWFSDTANWKKVLINYKSTQDNERIIVQFDATQPSPSSSFLAIAPSKDVFEVSSIYIIDFNQGAFSVPPSSLNQAEFLVNMAPPEFFHLRDFSNPNTIGPDESGGGISNNMLMINGLHGNHETMFFKAGYTYTIRFYIEAVTPVNEGVANPMLCHFAVYGASNGLAPLVYEPELSNSISGLGYVERSFTGQGTTVSDYSWGLFAYYCVLSISKVGIVETAPA